MDGCMHYIIVPKYTKLYQELLLPAAGQLLRRQDPIHTLGNPQPPFHNGDSDLGKAPFSLSL